MTLELFLSLASFVLSVYAVLTQHRRDTAQRRLNIPPSDA